MDLGSHLNHLWRILATGLGFLVFTTMGLLFRFVSVPLLILGYRDPSARKRAARKVIQVSFALFIRFLVFLRIMELHVQGAEKLNDQPRLLCPSHPTLIDVVILMSLVKNASCIVKASLKDSFALRAPIMAAGFVTNDSGPELVDTCAKALREGDSLIIFPEGTRTRPGVAPHLQHGAAATSLAADTPIIPIRITCEPPALMKGVPWYHVPPRKMRFTVQVLENIDQCPYSEMLKSEGRPIAVRRLTQRLKEKLFPASEIS